MVDVTADLRAGANTVVVQISSSLDNRLLAHGYCAQVRDVMSEIGGREPRMHSTEVHQYGLLGPVRLVREAASG